MKKALTINEARTLLKSEKVFATQSGFIFNDIGKYRSGLTFVLDSSFELNQDGKAINPTQAVEDREVTDSFNLDLDGDAEILFGDFWRNQKGTACFRPKGPQQAKHLLVCVGWGGCFNRHRGTWPEEAKAAGALYFRRASSNGGGAGHDYWVLPVGYVRQIDGGEAYRIDQQAARTYCTKHSKLQAERRSEADRLYKEKLAAEQASKEAKADLMPRLEEAAAAIRQLNGDGEIFADELTFDDDCFKLGYTRYLYAVEEVEAVEAYIERRRQVKARYEAEQAEKQRAYTEFAPRFEALQSRAQAVGLEIITDSQGEAVLKGSSLTQKGVYSYDTLNVFEGVIAKTEAAQEAHRQAEAKAVAEASAKEQGLPSDVRIWKRRGGRTGCSQGWVIDANGVDRERDRLYNENSRRADRYGEGYEIWNQILPGELVIQWSKDCTAADHICEVVHRPEAITEAQLERVAEIQAELTSQWEGLTGLASGKESPSIGDGWLGLLA